MRIAIGGISHETNTFNTVPTDLEQFRVATGEEIIRTLTNTNTVIGGFIDAAEEYQLDLIPTVYANAPPVTGLVTKKAFEYLEARLVQTMLKTQADGILINLHGAMVAAEYDDPEGHILTKLRTAVGNEVPIILVFDLHGNITQDWVDNTNVIIGYKTAPHTDMSIRGVEGGKAISSILRDNLQPTMAMAKPGILIGGGLMTVVDTPLDVIKAPLFWIMSRAREMEQNPDVVNVTVAGGFGHADVPSAGIGIIVTTNNDPTLATELVKELGDLTWQLRRGFLWDMVTTPINDAMRRAINSEESPVILADEGDNTAGGGPGDGTFLLQALKEVKWPNAALFIRDAASVHEAIQAGVGQEVTLHVGGKIDTLHGDPVLCTGRVQLISDGRFISVNRTRVDMGQTVVLECGQTHIVLTEHPTSQYEPAYFRSVGIEPREKKIIIVQSAHRFRHHFQVTEHLTERVIEVDTPGITSPNLSRFKFKNVHRPIFPLDDGYLPN
jgi:microcystin degradation protein MlrC